MSHVPKRHIYLNTVPAHEAVLKARATLDRSELVREVLMPAHEAAGRVLARGVHARHSSPTFHSSAMDGYAVLSRNTFMAREGSPVTLVEGETCFAVNTGHPLPEGCDAVIMIEQVERLIAPDNVNSCATPALIAIEAPVYPWQHVRRIGEDIVATELLFSRNHQLAPWDVGALLSAGVWEVPVWEQVRVYIIPTGDEVLDFTARPEPGKGQVVESNSQMLAALARNVGCVVERVPPVRDDAKALHKALCEALDSNAHVVVLCAGSSAGSKDFTRSTLEREGEILTHGIATMPGKPSILACCRGRLVAGAPGYPVSALVCFEALLAPLLCWLGHTETPRRDQVPVELTRAVPSRIGMEEHIRVAIGRVGQKRMATPLGRGAGNITTVTKAQGFIRLPRQSEGLAEGSTVQAELTVSENQLDRTLVCVGSHDNTLDLLADELMDGETPICLSSTHVGSMGGLTALRNGSCHLSGMHLFDPESGDFNFPFLKRFLPETPVVLVNVAIRHQGLIVQPGNPLTIAGLADLQRVRFINRQRGAGTRILLDWKLKQAGIESGSIAGYDKEEYTHMAVAANVLTGTADCGMGIQAAARALGLDFVPLALERYDLAIPACFMEDLRVRSVLELLQTPAFKQRVEDLGGYETRLTGQRMRPGLGLGLVGLGVE